MINLLEILQSDWNSTGITKLLVTPFLYNSEGDDAGLVRTVTGDEEPPEET